MSTTDTRMGGAREQFPETVWSTVLSTPDPGATRRRAALDQLFARYWRPVYAYVRAAWGKSIEDAKDLTQDFFRHILEWDFVARYRPDQGRFRHFLKGALRNFLAESHRHGARLKRGGGKPVVSLDVEHLETRAFLADVQAGKPEELFDRQWAADVLTEAVERLKRTLRKEGKELYFRIYEAVELHPGSEGVPTYEAVATKLGIPHHDVRNHLAFARKAFRSELKALVSEYVTTKRELAQEIHDLFSD